MNRKKMRGEYQFPDGLTYYPEFISPQEEQKILDFVSSLSYQEVRIHNQVAKRTVKHYGFKYDYEAVSITPGEQFPDLIQKLSDKCAHLANIPEKEIMQCLISHYPPGSTIGWHTDKFPFGPKIIGVSLLSRCVMRFQRKEHDVRYVYEQELEPRSAYILSGPARYKWNHSIPAVENTRYSITFRTIKEKKAHEDNL